MELQQIIIIVHVLIALAIIGLVLLQQGKGADMGASFGAGSSQTMFGAGGGGNMLTRATAVLAAAFFSTSVALAIVARDVARQGVAFDAPIPELVEDAPSIPEASMPAEPTEPEIPDFDSKNNTGPASGIPGVDD